SPMHYFPIALPFLLLFALFLVFLVLLIEIGLLRYAYERIGVGRRHMFALLLLSFLGSYVNIPVYELPPHRVESDMEINFQGMRYVVPEVADWPGTVVAINVGGAVIPALLSLYLIRKNRLYLRSLLGIAMVAFCVHYMAYPVKGVGIAVPVFVPPLVATMVALLLSRRRAPPLSYITGSLGTLIGADLLNLGKIQGLGAPVASIGGAGTFDGIFLTGILSVLLVSIMTRRGGPAEA
ncbi:MAG: DUF1614 domain-containing protein, partial [Syntrophorhabdales bacterium]